MKLPAGVGISSVVVFSVVGAAVCWVTAHALFRGLHEQEMVSGADATLAGTIAGGVGGFAGGVVAAAGTAIAAVRSRFVIPAVLGGVGMWALAGAVGGALGLDQFHVVAGALAGTGATIAALLVPPKQPAESAAPAEPAAPA
jgi:hypothetical protein